MSADEPLCPTLPIAIPIPEGKDAVDLRDLPTSPGVFVFENATGQTLALAMTANLRRRVAAKLTPPEDGKAPTRRIDYRKLVRTVRAVPCGSDFECEWAALQLTRKLIPHAAAPMVDRWPSWFIHCNPATKFPRFVKTTQPGAAPTGAAGAYLGPFPDKHIAHKYIDMLESMFDLCRYHHILIEAPNANACAYKEMGRCAAPCDGSVSLDVYRDQMSAAIEFAATPIAEWKTTQENLIEHCSADLDFERAAAEQRRLEDAKVAQRPLLRYVDRLEHLRYVIAAPSGKDGAARVLTVNGGEVAQIDDVPFDSQVDQLAAICETASDHFSQTAINAVRFREHDWYRQNIAWFCHQLFDQSSKKKSRPARSLFAESQWNDDFDAEDLSTLLRRLKRAIDQTKSQIEESTDKDESAMIELADQ